MQQPVTKLTRILLRGGVVALGAGTAGFQLFDEPPVTLSDNYSASAVSQIATSSDRVVREDQTSSSRTPRKMTAIKGSQTIDKDSH